MELTLQEKLTYTFLKLFTWVLSLMPRRFTLMLGRWLAFAVWTVFPIRKQVALKNLAIAFPDNNRRTNLRILRNSYRHFGMVFMDFFTAPYMSREKLERLISVEGISLEELKTQKSGIMYTAHLGNWEILLHIFGHKGFMFSAVATVQRNKGAHKFFNELRECTGSKIIFRNESSRKMLGAVKTGFLGLASDQWAGKSGLRMDFFGKTTSMATGAAIFHLKTGAPVFYAYCILSPDFRYKLYIKKLDLTNLPQTKQEAILAMNKLAVADLEDRIRQVPEQYFWFHRKWRK